jgi:hypothetical protein
MPIWLQPRLRHTPKTLWLKMSVNSMNNRFAFRRYVDTECVISVDDDIVIPHDVVEYLFRVWRGDFFQHIVGHVQFSRHHYHDGFVWKFENASSRRSIALTGGGAVLHRNLLKEYMSPRFRDAREIVYNAQNCEDILMNIVATNVTGRGPAVVLAMSNVEVEAVHLNKIRNGFLLQREDDLAVRQACMQIFHEMFGRDLLVDTISLFDKNVSLGAAGVAGRHHYLSSPNRVDTWLTPSRSHFFWLD